MGKRKGCFHCCKRRIVCDMTEPRCQKCTKKGLDCSGPGIRYRFNTGIASRGKYRGREIPSLDEPVMPSRSSGRTGSPGRTPSLKGQNILIKGTVNEETRIIKQNIRWNPESLDGQTRFLFSHFSNQIARFMVALDTQFNGYRTILLPLAYHDPDVRKAVCVVSALHLGARSPDLRRQARANRGEMILGLRQAVDREDWARILHPSHWAVLLLFLVGEIVTGGDDFRYLVKMLLSLVQAHGGSLECCSSEVYSFLLRESRMMELFGCPFLGEVEAIHTLSKGTDYYCGWVSSILEYSSDTEHQMVVAQIRSAVHLASEIYLHRAISSSSQDLFNVDPASESEITRLKWLVHNVEADTPGSPAFVWVNFIGAAGSQTPDDRAFFRHKLEEMYDRIGFENIRIGLEGLDQLLPGQEQGQGQGDGQRWTAMLPSVATVVM